MKTRLDRIVWVALGVASLVTPSAVGCRADPASSTLATNQTAPPDRQKLKPPDLPDLSRMAATVQEQVRDAHASLIGLWQNDRTTTAALATAYGRVGMLLMAAESFAEAEPYFLSAQAFALGDMRWPYYLGQLSKLEGASEKAAAFFERALQLRPDDVATLIWLGNVYLDQGRPELAQPLFERAASHQPRVFAAQFGLGRAALAKREYGLAAEHFEKALALDQRASIAHYPLALAYRGLGKLAEAESHLRRRGYVDTGPPDPLMLELAGLLRSATVYEARGDRAIARGDFASAAPLFRRGLELAPDRLAIRQKLATAMVLTGDVKGAVAEYQEILRRSPNFAEAHYSLGVLFLGSGRSDLAIERFATAVRADPTYIQARLQLANALRRSDRARASLPEYTKVIELDPRIGEARFGYALALARLKRYHAARERLAEGMKVHPDRPEFADALARLLAASPEDEVRNGPLALSVARGLLESTQTSSAYEAVAMALAETGQYDEAASRQRDAIAAFTRAGAERPTAQLTDNLALYERRRPCRRPWRDEPVWNGP